MRVLVVEDEERVASFVKRGLEEEGYSVDLAADGSSGTESAITGAYQVVLLDVQIPGKNGFEVLQEIRAKGVTCPVMMLTVRGAVEDKVWALNAGADDYLPKPFAFAELVARVKALTRRAPLGTTGNGDVLEAYGMRMDRLGRRVSREGQPLELTATEYSLLELFLKHPGEVLPRAQIAEEVWGYDFDVNTNIVDVYVNYVRKKVDQKHPVKLIQTVRGVGYAFRPAQDTRPT